MLPYYSWSVLPHLIILDRRFNNNSPVKIINKKVYVIRTLFSLNFGAVIKKKKRRTFEYNF